MYGLDEMAGTSAQPLSLQRGPKDARLSSSAMVAQNAARVGFPLFGSGRRLIPPAPFDAASPRGLASNDADGTASNNGVFWCGGRRVASRRPDGGLLHLVVLLHRWQLMKSVVVALEPRKRRSHCAGGDNKAAESHNSISVQYVWSMSCGRFGPSRFLCHWRACKRLYVFEAIGARLLCKGASPQVCLLQHASV